MEFNEVHSDSRRTIFASSELLGNKEFTFIKLNKGKAIGGCMHNKKEYYMIVKGLLGVTIGVNEFLKGPSDGGIINPGEPHMFRAIEDSIICEWGISAKDKQDQPKDLNMLEEVNNINGS